MTKLSILSGLIGGFVGVYVMMFTDYTDFQKLIMLFLCIMALGLVYITLMIEKVLLILEIFRAEQRQLRRHNK